MEKKAFVSKEQVEEIVKTYPTPFYLYDEKGIRENVENVKKAFAWNPGFRVYFAVKATPNPAIVSILSACFSKASMSSSESPGRAKLSISKKKSNPKSRFSCSYAICSTFVLGNQSTQH